MLALAGAVAAPTVSADGDPASDVLASGALFLPADAGLTPGQQAQLRGELALARAAGVRLRLAVIAGPADLGSVGALWRDPRGYARFLGQEIAAVAPGPLLVVMPNGYGYASPARDGGAAALARLSAPGRGLGPGAVEAIRRLAAAAGHPLALAAVSDSGRAGAGAGALPWVVFGLGWLAIAVAWGYSVRARPLGRPSAPDRPVRERPVRERPAPGA